VTKASIASSGSLETAQNIGNVSLASESEPIAGRLEKLAHVLGAYFGDEGEQLANYSVAVISYHTHAMTQQEIDDFRKEAHLIWTSNPLPDGSRRHVVNIYRGLFLPVVE